MTGRARIRVCIVAAAISAAVWSVACPSAASVVTPPEEKKYGPLEMSPSSDIAVSAAGASLRTKVLWRYVGDSFFDPRSVQRVGDGTLVAVRDQRAVKELAPNGDVRWQYPGNDLNMPFSAQRLPNGNTLIADRGTQLPGNPDPNHTGARVIEVDEAGNVVWQYGTGYKGLGANQLMDPFAATRLTGSANTLIVDNRDACRVIEVDQRKRIVWQYGVTGVAGKADGYLSKPKSALRLADGSTLICDEDLRAVLRVSRDKKILWRFGTSDIPDPVIGPKFVPLYAEKLANGNFLVTDDYSGRERGRVFEVNPATKAIVWEWGKDPATPADGVLRDPRVATRLPSGITLIADQENRRVIELGTMPSATAQSSLYLNFGVEAPKTLVGMKWDVYKPPSTSVTLTVELDTGATFSSSSGSITFPLKTKVNFVRYRATLSTSDRSRTPLLKSVTFRYYTGDAPIEHNQPGPGPSPNPTDALGAHPTGGGSNDATQPRQTETLHYGAQLTSTGTSGTGGAGGSSGGTSGTGGTGGTGTNTGAASASGSAGGTGDKAAWRFEKVDEKPLSDSPAEAPPPPWGWGAVGFLGAFYMVGFVRVPRRWPRLHTLRARMARG